MFIVLEGPDGTGKTTIMDGIERALGPSGVHPTLVRDPGGHPISERLREIMTDNPMSPEERMMMYLTTRAITWQRSICPVLARGGVVISDRWTPSTFVYQAYLRGARRALDGSPPSQVRLTDMLDMIHDQTCQLSSDHDGHGYRPDLVIHLDAPVDVLQRRMANREKDDPMDPPDATMKAVCEGYRHEARYAQQSHQDHYGEWVTIDASEIRGVVFGRVIRTILDRLLGENRPRRYHDNRG